MRRKSMAMRLLGYIAFPFALILFVIYSMFFYIIKENQIQSYNVKMHNTAKYNTSRIELKCDSVLSLVVQMARHYDILLAQNLNDRDLFDSKIKALLDDSDIFNAWFAFEPNSFDGKDSLHTKDYPGAPSGRFMRSYLWLDGEKMLAPDMDERIINDIEICPWYATAYTTNGIYMDYSSAEGNVYDYNVSGIDPAFTLSIASPVRKNGTPIGCVGADLELVDSLFDTGELPGAYLAVFYEDGNFFYAPNQTLDVSKVAFTVDSENISMAFAQKADYFNSSYVCPATGELSYVYLYPADIDNCRTVFIYISVPVRFADLEYRPIVFSVSAVFGVMLLCLAVLLYFTSLIITGPARKLTLAANRISMGDVSAKIPVFDKSQDEISIMSQAIHQMAEQLRINLQVKEEQKLEEELAEKLQQTLSAGDEPSECIFALASLLRSSVNIERCRIVVKIHAKMQLVSSSAQGEDELREVKEFLGADELEQILGDKNLIYMNAFTLKQHSLSFISPHTSSLLIVAIKNDGALTGYIILESFSTTRCLAVFEENLTLRLGKELSQFFAETSPNKIYGEAYSQKTAAIHFMNKDISLRQIKDTKTEAFESSLLGKLSHIHGIDVDRALSAMGGIEELYLDAAAAFAKMLPDCISTLDDSIKNDLSLFKATIHKIKSSLASIGFYGYHKTAAALELLAGENDWETCKRKYFNFRQVLGNISASLNEYLAQKNAAGSGGPSSLGEALDHSHALLQEFNAPKALKLLEKFSGDGLGEKEKALFSSLKHDLAMYQVDHAAAKLEELRGLLEGAVNSI